MDKKKLDKPETDTILKKDNNKKNIITKGERTKRYIFDTSVELFKSFGFNNVTISDITKACNVSKGTFYTHFTTKADIIAIQYEIIDNLYGQYFKENNDKGVIALGKYLEYVFSVVESEVGREMVKNLYAENLQGVNMMALTSEKRNLHRVLREIVNCEEMSSINAQEVVNASIVILRGVCFEWANSSDDNKQNNIKKFYSTLLDNFILGLKNNTSK